MGVEEFGDGRKRRGRNWIKEEVNGKKRKKGVSGGGGREEAEIFAINGKERKEINQSERLAGR